MALAELPRWFDVFIESNNTDVVVLLLFHMDDFAKLGLKRLWTHLGKGVLKPVIFTFIECSTKWGIHFVETCSRAIWDQVVTILARMAPRKVRLWRSLIVNLRALERQ